MIQKINQRKLRKKEKKKIKIIKKANLGKNQISKQNNKTKKTSSLIMMNKRNYKKTY